MAELTCILSPVISSRKVVLPLPFTPTITIEKGVVVVVLNVVSFEARIRLSSSRMIFFISAIGVVGDKCFDFIFVIISDVIL